MKPNQKQIVKAQKTEEKKELVPKPCFEEIKITSNASKIQEVDKSYFPEYAQGITEELSFPKEIANDYLTKLKAFLASKTEIFDYVAAFMGKDENVTLYTITGKNGEGTADFSERTFTFLLDAGKDREVTEHLLGKIYNTLKEDGCLNMTSLFGKVGKEVKKILLERK